MSVQIPGYKILRTLGRGGMATVYLAIQEVFEREVALKVMSKVLAEDPNFGQRFFREAKIVSKLVHPHIVTVHDVGMHEGYCYLSMEYIDGKDLKYMTDHLTLRQKVRAVRDIAKALDYAGAKGYVHRDIKPENIMFHSSDGRAVLMDFGIARAAESDTQVTQAGTAIGTPHYMSPEQAKGKNVDGRSDIYSLGVVFFFILAGRVPFDAESAVAIGIKHITEPVPLLPKAFEAFQPIIDKMMAKEVAKRYQNALELMADIDNLDLDLIEHTVEIAKHNENIRNTPKIAEAPTLSHPDDDMAEAFEVDEDHIPDVDTFNYSIEDDPIKDRSSILALFLSGVFVVSVIAGFFYFKNPDMANRWIDSIVSKAAPAEKEPVHVAREVTALPTPEVAVEPPIKPISKTPPEQATPSPEEIATQNAQRIQALSNQLESLHAAYVKDPIYLSELVETYRRLIELDNENPSWSASFENLQESEMTKLMAYAQKNGQSNTLDKRIAQMRSLFPGQDKATFERILKVADTRKRVISMILEAEAYLSQNNLTKPAGRNALEFYDRALKLDPSNEVALAGKTKIANKLASLAAKRIDAKNYESAQTLIQKALEIDSQNANALTLDRKITEVLGKKQQIRSLLRTAESKLDRAQLFTPEKQGAYYDYQRVLALDPHNVSAKAGVERVIDKLSSTVWQLIGDEQFLQAKEMMRAPIEALGSHSRVQSLGLAVDEIVGEKILDVQPRIAGIVVDGKPFSTISTRPVDGFSADRSIFLGFRYENFQTETTVIQAVLMDGAKRIQIAQVPVVIEGDNGESTFRIDRPVEGFPAGSYSIEMRLGSETLNSMVFKVE